MLSEGRFTLAHPPTTLQIQMIPRTPGSLFPPPLLSGTCEGRFWEVFGGVLEGTAGGTHPNAHLFGNFSPGRPGSTQRHDPSGIHQPARAAEAFAMSTSVS